MHEALRLNKSASSTSTMQKELHISDKLLNSRVYSNAHWNSWNLNNRKKGLFCL